MARNTEGGMGDLTEQTWALEVDEYVDRELPESDAVGHDVTPERYPTQTISEASRIECKQLDNVMTEVRNRTPQSSQFAEYDELPEEQNYSDMTRRRSSHVPDVLVLTHSDSCDVGNDDNSTTKSNTNIEEDTLRGSENVVSTEEHIRRALQNPTMSSQTTEGDAVPRKRMSFFATHERRRSQQTKHAADTLTQPGSQAPFSQARRGRGELIVPCSELAHSPPLDSQQEVQHGRSNDAVGTSFHARLDEEVGEEIHEQQEKEQGVYGQLRLPTQAAHGNVVVTATLMPMNIRTLLRVPVHRYESETNYDNPIGRSGSAIETQLQEQKEAQHGQEAVLTETNEPLYSDTAWILLAKELFEATAVHLCIHPQSFYIWHNNKRVRFLSRLFLPCDNTASVTHPSGLGTDAEPIWVTVTFSPLNYLAGQVTSRNCERVRRDLETLPSIPSTSITSIATTRNELPQSCSQYSSSDYTDNNAARDAANAHVDANHANRRPTTTTTANMNDNNDAVGCEGAPVHLAHLREGEVLLRCVMVRRQRRTIEPRELVALRSQRHAASYASLVQSIYREPQMVGESSEDDTMTHMVPVAIVSEGNTRPVYLGGYRARADRTRVFLHAATQLFMHDLPNGSTFFPQTSCADAAAPMRPMHSRTTQTRGTTRSVQTQRECCVQTQRPDVYQDTQYDVLVPPRPYFTAAALHALRVQMAVVIQTFYRQWKARQERRRLAQEELAKQRRVEARQKREEAVRLESERGAQWGQSNALNAHDFQARQEQIAADCALAATSVMSDATLQPDARRAALRAITKQQLQQIQALDRRRRRGVAEVQEKRFERMVAATAAAKQWGTVRVETPATQRAAELRHLYHRLSESARHGTPMHERLDTLLLVKCAVGEYRDALTQEMTQLMDREADLLSRHRKDTSLDGLRTRIGKLFRRFIEDPENNPSMAEFTKTAVGRAKAAALHRAKQDPSATNKTRRSATHT